MSDAENLQRVERMLERIGRSTRQATPLMAELLGLRVQETLSHAEITPAQRKNATLEILETFLVTPLDGATRVWSSSRTNLGTDRAGRYSFTLPWIDMCRSDQPQRGEPQEGEETDHVSDCRHEYG